MNEILIDSKYLDIASRMMGHGAYNASIQSVLRGVNMLTGYPILPPNIDEQGYVFFTKPMMNLSHDNCANNRKMLLLHDTSEKSMGNAIRCMLCPKSSDFYGALIPENQDKRSDLVDDDNAFIPLLTNLLISASGWLDYMANVYKSDAGIGGQQVAHAMGRTDILSEWTMQAVFRNTDGDPITSLLTTWLEYSLHVYQGTMTPFPINLVENVLDYTTRIYKLTMDKSRTFVHHIHTTFAFPFFSPIGRLGDYNAAQLYSDAGHEVTFQFQCVGSIVDDPILPYEFNQHVMNNCVGMRDEYRATSMVKVGSNVGLNEKAILNFRGYPRINTESNELEWYVKKDDYNEITSLFTAIKAVEIHQETGAPINEILKSPDFKSYVTGKKQ